MKYKFQNLLEKMGGGITGAMSPFMMAMLFCKEFQFELNGLTRVQFESDSLINQEYEDRKNKTVTGYDTLIVTEINPKFNCMGMFIDLGSEFLPVGLWFSDEHEDKFLISPIYKKYPLERKIMRQELLTIFKDLNSKTEYFVPKEIVDEDIDDLLDKANQKHTTQ